MGFSFFYDPLADCRMSRADGQIECFLLNLFRDIKDGYIHPESSRSFGNEILILALRVLIKEDKVPLELFPIQILWQIPAESEFKRPTHGELIIKSDGTMTWLSPSALFPNITDDFLYRIAC